MSRAARTRDESRATAAVGRTSPRVTGAALPAGAVRIADCVADEHETLLGRVRVRWHDGEPRESWVPTLAGVVPREGDRVLLVRPDNGLEPVVVGVIDGLLDREAPPRREAARLVLRPDEALKVTTRDGREVVEIHEEASGPVVRLLDERVDLELAGDLRIGARSIALEARAGDARIRATGDVHVDGETIRANCD